MAIEIIKPGMLAMVQDKGRYGYRRFGVNCNGSMDETAARVANILVGNKDTLPVIEFTLAGAAIKFTSDHLIALCGGDMNPYLNNQPIEMWQPVLVKKDSTLSFAQNRNGCRIYLAVAGGFAIKQVLNSYSTSLRAHIGGYDGRSLRAGDRLEACKIPSQSRSAKLWQALERMERVSFHAYHFASVYDEVVAIRFVEGPDFAALSKTSQQAWLEESWRIDIQSDRMGYRLQGPELELELVEEKISEGVTNGTIQLPANGQPIILLADRQTIGGYPKIAVVAAVDIPMLGQLKPGQLIRFVKISLSEAEQLYLEYEQDMDLLEAAIEMKSRL